MQTFAASSNAEIVEALIGEAFLRNSIGNVNFIGDDEEALILPDGYTFQQVSGTQTVAIGQSIFLTSGTFPGETNTSARLQRERDPRPATATRNWMPLRSPPFRLPVRRRMRIFSSLPSSSR